MGAFSKLHVYTYERIRMQFPRLHISENAYPEWLISSNLTRLEIDIYIEELSLAIEVQGAQHYQFIPFFHGTYENFEKRKMYDQEKRDLCYGRKIKLVEIETEKDADVLVKDIIENGNSKFIKSISAPKKCVRRLGFEGKAIKEYDDFEGVFLSVQRLGYGRRRRRNKRKIQPRKLGVLNEQNNKI